MADLHFIPYNDEIHRVKYHEMMVEYGKWLDNEVYAHYGVRLFQDEDIPIVLGRMTPIWASLKPPEGIICIIEADGEVVGVGRLNTLEEGVGGVHNVWTCPKDRGKGYATRLMEHIEGQARAFGFTSIRLDTQRFNLPAQSLYRKIGYKEIERYTGDTFFENENLRKYYAEKVYMEKKL
jgi:ribosomal protein S18 acetylase RimI-like enzyme